MKLHRIALLFGALLAGASACTDKPNEGYGAVRQRIDMLDADADADADADVDVDPDAFANSDVANVCAHPICAAGTSLSATCDPCAAALCAQDPYCCTVAWDLTCVGEVTSICGQSCLPDAGASDGAGTACAHPLCAIGGPLASGCDPCAGTLCAMDAYCCAVAWDGTCVNEVGTICGQACN